MATEQKDNADRLERLNANLARIEELSQRLVTALARRRPHDTALHAPSNELYLKAAAAYLTELVSHPTKLIEQQVGYWGKTLQHFIEAQQALAEGKAPSDPTPPDKRFAGELWQTNPWFNFLKQQYLLNTEAVAGAVDALEGLDERDRKRVAYFSRQIVDLLSPTNFLGSNPEALAKAVETDGASLVQGLENLVRDVEANQGDLVVTLSDKSAFEVGRNLAMTPGKVVFRNRMLELIQYAPATDQVWERPVVFFPPWINKFYILDLRPQNSLVKWLTEQGFTVFVVSWVNPDGTYAQVSMDDYVSEGYHAALNAAREICGTETVNATGYCIAGTTLALTLARMEAEGRTLVNAVTFFTTLTDFSDPGEVGVFLDNDFVDGIEREVGEAGVLRSLFMSRTFSYLRSNDLIYQPAIRSYMMGESPPAFDLLFWNGDATNLPGRMAVEYLRGLCQKDEFARTGFPVLGRKVTLREVKVPLFAVACETDHIAPWRASYNGIVQMGSPDKTFVLAEAGHIAGIVNPPSRGKYGHWTNTDLDLDPQTWKSTAGRHPGSWWPRWADWLKARSGGKVPARVPGATAGYPALADAPGTYVTAQPDP